jgi:hypothetical protein
LDCCSAVKAIDSLETEVLAAAIDTAGATIKTCFTNALLRTLRRELSGPQRSTTFAEIYAHMLRNKDDFGLEAIPLHVTASKRSVAIRRLAGAGSFQPPTEDESNKPSTLKATITAHLDDKLTSQNINELKMWFTTSIPSNVRRIDIQFEGIFETESYLAIFTVPIEVWSCLRVDQAYGVLGLTKGGNKLLQTGTGQVLGTAVTSKGRENVRPRPSKN